MSLGENEAPADTSAPAPDEASASSSSRNGMPPIRTISRSGRRVSGNKEAETDTDQRLRASIRRRNSSTVASTEEGNFSACDKLKW